MIRKPPQKVINKGHLLPFCRWLEARGWELLPARDGAIFVSARLAKPDPAGSAYEIIIYHRARGEWLTVTGEGALDLAKEFRRHVDQQ